MNTLFYFMAEASVAMVLFYSVYWFVLRTETCFRINRFFLLGSLIGSVLLSLFPVRYQVLLSQTGNPALVEGMTEAYRNGRLLFPGIQNAESGLNWFYFIQYIYYAGLAWFLLRLIFQSARLVIHYYQSSVRRYDNVQIIESRKYKVPFSFFNLIFYNPENISREDFKEIVAHEKVHIHERHWVDLLFTELFTIVFWFNPFVWFFERSVKQNHEYLADEGVLAQGHKVGRYQALLINQLMGVPVVGIANHLNDGINTTRFKMMTKKRDSKFRAFRLVWALPVIAGLLLAFAEPVYRYQPAGQNVSDQKNALVTNVQDLWKITSVVVKTDGTPLEGASVVLQGTTVGTMTDSRGKFELSVPGDKPIILVFSYVGYETLRLPVDLKAKADLKITMKEGVMILDPDQLQEAPPPPPPPPPPSGAAQGGIPSTTKKVTMAPPPPPPPPPSGEKTEGTPDLTKKVTKDALFRLVEELPQYPGGSGALYGYVKEMEQKMAQAKGLKGIATIGFKVNEEGKVVDVKVVNQENETIGNAAASVVAGLKNWSPGKQNGKPVPVNCQIRVEFP